MICLEKLQKELARLTNTDLKSLPSVQDALRERGYTSIIKGKEIIELTQKETHFKLNDTQKEQRGIYNVTYNGKNAAYIHKDLQRVDEALAIYTKGYIKKGERGKGAQHIKIKHLTDPSKEGYITDLELVNMGNSMREYLKQHKRPFIETNKNGDKAHIYEWENNGVRYRIAVEYRLGGGTTAHSHLSNNHIITFYSDRNLKEPMQFKNPAIENPILYKLEEDFNNPSIFKKAVEATLDKTLRSELIQDTFNRLGLNTSKNKDYMDLREQVLNATNSSVKAMVDLNNLLNAKFNKEQLIQLQRYYVGDAYDSKIINDELKGVADLFKEKIIKLTQEGIKKGIYPEYYAKITDYLTRKYESKEFTENGKLISSVLAFHKEFHRGTSKLVSKETLEKMRKNGEIGDYKKGKWAVSENEVDGKIEIYRDWSKQEREAMGEIEDFSYNVARTIDNIQKQLYTHDFIKAMEEKGIMVRLNPEQKTPQGYIEFAKEYGVIGNPFRGYAIKAEVASDLKDTFYKLYGDSMKIAKAFKSAVSFWKAGKTIWNPVSHVNNMGGNLTFMLASGEYGAAKNFMKNLGKTILGNQVFKSYARYKELSLRDKHLKDLTQAQQQELQKLNTQENKLLELLELRGYFDKSFLNNIVDNYHTKHNGLKKEKEWWLKRVHNKLGNAYNAEDVLARLSLSQAFLEKGMKLEEALKLTSAVLPDYSKPMPYWLRQSDRYGILPFVQFIYHATPIMLRQLKPVHKGEVNKQALAALLAIGAYGAYHQLIQPLPDGYFGSEFAYFKNGDDVKTIRIGSLIPHIQMLEFLPFSGNGDGNMLPEFIRKSLTGNVYLQAAGVAQNQNYTFNRPITRRKGIEGVADRIGGAIDFALPAPIGKVYTMANNALTKDSKNKRSKIHNERTGIEATMGLLGLNLKSFNARELERKKQRDRLKEKS